MNLQNFNPTHFIIYNLSIKYTIKYQNEFSKQSVIVIFFFCMFILNKYPSTKHYYIHQKHELSYLKSIIHV